LPVVPAAARPRGRTVRVSHRYGAPPAEVFGAWLDAHVARRFLFATALRPMREARVEPRVDGEFRFAESAGAPAHTGRYVEIVPERRLVFTLRGPLQHRDTGRVRVEIEPRARGCALTLTHEEVPHRVAAHARDRWRGILYGLDMTLQRA
jgi:uncharacterized protein YndB with AHSA1/START domain